MRPRQVRLTFDKQRNEARGSRLDFTLREQDGSPVVVFGDADTPAKPAVKSATPKPALRGRGE